MIIIYGSGDATAPVSVLMYSVLSPSSARLMPRRAKNPAVTFSDELAGQTIEARSLLRLPWLMSGLGMVASCRLGAGSAKEAKNYRPAVRQNVRIDTRDRTSGRIVCSIGYRFRWDWDHLALIEDFVSRSRRVCRQIAAISDGTA